MHAMPNLTLLASIPLMGFEWKLFYTLLALMIIDVASGLLKAYQQRKLQSHAMREGLVRKAQMLLMLLAIAILEYHAWGTQVAAKAFLILCCISELRSIAENAAQAGFDVREWIQARFGGKNGGDSAKNS